LFASICARFVRAQQLRRYREAISGPVAVAVPVFTGVAPNAPAVRAGGAPSAGSIGGSIGGSGAEGGAAGGAPEATRSSAATEGAAAVEAASGDRSHLAGGGGDAPTEVVQGRRIDREML